MSVLLDTNACIALINGTPAAVRERFDRWNAGGDRAFTSAVVLFELWYGVAKSGRPERNAERVRTLLSGPMDVVPLDDADAQVAGRVRAELEAKGTPIGAYDLLIAGQALRRRLTLVTANRREFAMVPDLVCEDWSGPLRRDPAPEPEP